MRRNLLYFAPVAFASYAQRPHFMVRTLLRNGIDRVVWVDPYPTRLPRWDDVLRKAERLSPVSIEAGVEVICVRSAPVEPIPGGATVNSMLFWRDVRSHLRELTESGKWLIGVGRPSALAVWALEKLPHIIGFYDAMDDFPAFYGGLSALSMARRERRVVDLTEVRFCSSHRLLSKLRAMGSEAHLLLNGYDMSQLPSPLAADARRWIGYVGTIGRWFDWPLVVEMATALPEWPFRLVGPEFIARPRVLPANIEIVPACPQPSAIEYVRRFAVGLIPFLRSRLTDSVDPIKYYEYRAMGVPVWSTGFGEMAGRTEADGVVKIERGVEWSSLLDRTRQMETTERALVEFRAGADWNRRFELLAARILHQ